jgi:hypothetical protein
MILRAKYYQHKKHTSCFTKKLRSVLETTKAHRFIVHRDQWIFIICQIFSEKNLISNPHRQNNYEIKDHSTNLTKIKILLIRINLMVMILKLLWMTEALTSMNPLNKAKDDNLPLSKSLMIQRLYWEREAGLYPLSRLKLLRYH